MTPERCRQRNMRFIICTLETEARDIVLRFLFRVEPEMIFSKYTQRGIHRCSVNSNYVANLLIGIGFQCYIFQF
jgi:hypothetical protein